MDPRLDDRFALTLGAQALLDGLQDLLVAHLERRDVGPAQVGEADLGHRPLSLATRRSQGPVAGQDRVPVAVPAVLDQPRTADHDVAHRFAVAGKDQGVEQQVLRLAPEAG